ncbi:MAG: PAS domain S-box protein, partial [bacterium]|nr:PAS domain S-box protein [bacterium]
MDKELPKTWGPVLFEALEKDSIGVIITDCRGVIRYSNPPFSRITGFSQGEVLGRNPKISQSGQTPPETYQSLWMTILHGGTWRGELLNKTKTGDYYWESLTIIPIRDSQNKIAYFAGIIVDITLKKKMEKIRGLSAGAMAHEMKSPLAIIQLAAENLRDALSGPVTEEQKGVLQG